MKAATQSGIALYSDGEDVFVDAYSGIDHKYHCGKEYIKPVIKAFLPYLLVAIDANEATVGITDGDKIQVLWSDTSLVPRKQDAGGMSNRRYERGREMDLIHWLRKVADIIKDNHYYDGRQLIVGGPGMTKERFIKELPEYIANRVSNVESCCYTDENGLYEMIKKSRYKNY